MRRKEEQMTYLNLSTKLLLLSWADSRASVLIFGGVLVCCSSEKDWSNMNTVVRRKRRVRRRTVLASRHTRPSGEANDVDCVVADAGENAAVTRP